MKVQVHLQDIVTGCVPPPAAAIISLTVDHCSIPAASSVRPIFSIIIRHVYLNVYAHNNNNIAVVLQCARGVYSNIVSRMIDGEDNAP